MAILNILNYPDPRLHTIAKPIEVVDNSIRKLIDDMAETMYSAPGIGLAATQVDRHLQLILVDISETKDNLKVFINPKIIESSGQQVYEEGCLSVPDVFESVKRAEYIRVQALDREGKSFELEAEGLLAVCIQHEMDHLLGKVFVEYLSSLKRNRIKIKMKKRAKEISNKLSPIKKTDFPRTISIKSFIKRIIRRI